MLSAGFAQFINLPLEKSWRFSMTTAHFSIVSTSRPKATAVVFSVIILGVKPSNPLPTLDIPSLWENEGMTLQDVPSVVNLLPIGKLLPRCRFWHVPASDMGMFGLLNQDSETWSRKILHHSAKRIITDGIVDISKGRLFGNVRTFGFHERMEKKCTPRRRQFCTPSKISQRATLSPGNFVSIVWMLGGSFSLAKWGSSSPIPTLPLSSLDNLAQRGPHVQFTTLYIISMTHSYECSIYPAHHGRKIRCTCPAIKYEPHKFGYVLLSKSHHNNIAMSN